jgi:D-3-phosphoglycerate dehydrogenase
MTILFVGKFPMEILQPLTWDILTIDMKQAKAVTAHYLELLAKADVVVARSGCSFSSAVLSNAEKLKLIIKAGAGIDMVDLDYCAQHGIEVRNTPGANATSVAELAIGLAIALSRHLTTVHQGMQQGQWLKNEPQGCEISGKNFTVVGYGYTGRRTVQLLNAFNCTVRVFDPTLSEQELDHLKLQGGIHAPSLMDSMADTDFLILHPSLSIGSEHLIDERALVAMPQGAKVINLARGEIIVEADLLTALQSGHLGGAAIDTWWEEPPQTNPFAQLSNVIMTPHIGANTAEALQRTTKQAIKLIEERWQN